MLNDKLAGALTHKQYIEILGFIAPSDSAAKPQWEQAVQRSVGLARQKDVLNAALKLNMSVFEFGSVAE
jgi:hypothetical protein